jgi:hypothetical protein
MIKDVERYNQEDRQGQIQSSAGFKLWSHTRKEKAGKEPKRITKQSDSSGAYNNSEPILSALPQLDKDQ